MSDSRSAMEDADAIKQTRASIRAEAEQEKAPEAKSAKSAKSAIDQAAPITTEIEAPQPQAFPMAAFRWREIDAEGNKVLEQAHRVEQLGKTLGVMWKELETIPFGNVVDPTK